MFPRPAVATNSPLLQKLGINVDGFRLALTRAGVCMNLDDLAWERCYEVLLRLPESSPQGDGAIPFYRMLAEKEEDIDLDAVHARNEFQTSGKLWARLGQEHKYRDVSDKVFFVTDATVPAAVVNAFPIVELPKRRGTEKLQRVFCIQVLRAADISIEVADHIALARTEVLNDAVEKLKPFVLAVRFAANPDATGILRLKKMKIVACSSVKAVASLGDTEIPIQLEKIGESLICGETAYLIVSGIETESPLDDAVTADSIANILASVLQVDHTNEFARLATTRHDARQQVLSLILQHDGGEPLRRAREALEMSEEDEIQPEMRTVRPTVPPGPPVTLPVVKTPVDLGATPLPSTQQPSLPAGVSSQRLDHTPQPSATTIPFRVRSERTHRGNVEHVRGVTDGARCERLAILHETEQGRFPVPVGSIQGDQAFGCDVLSFATEADRAEFQVLLQQGTIGNLEKVVRFIEVKGRRTETGPVALEGNQLREARRRREHYYIYRVYEAAEGEEWRIAALKNPLDYNWPESYKVDPLQRTEAELWSVRVVRDGNQDKSTS